MGFELVWSPKAKDHLLALDRDVQVRVIKKVAATTADPGRHYRKLVGRPGWRLRVGDYRVIADIDPVAKRVVILAIGHRKNIY